MLSARREISQKETATRKFKTNPEGQPFIPNSLRKPVKPTTSDLLKEDEEALEVIEEAKQVTETYQKAMTDKLNKLASLELQKRKDKFKKKFCEALHKITMYELLYYRICKRNEPGFIEQNCSDKKLIFTAATTYLRNLPHGFATRLHAESNNALTEFYKLDFDLEANATTSESDTQMDIIIFDGPETSTTDQELTIADAVYIGHLTSKLADIIPRITINLWDILSQRDQFREINAQLELLEIKHKQNQANQDVAEALDKAGAAEIGVRDIIRQELDRAEKIKLKQARKKSLANDKTQSSRPNNGQSSQKQSRKNESKGGRNRQKLNKQSTGASGRGIGTRDKQRKNKQKNGNQEEPLPQAQRNVNRPTRPHSQGRGRGGRNSPENRGGASNAGRGRGRGGH
jgi:hypothetical protein